MKRMQILVSLLPLAEHPSLGAVPPLGQILVTGWNGMYEFTVFLRLEWNREIAETREMSGLCQVVRIGNRSPEWQWLKVKEGGSLQKQNKGRSKDWSQDLRWNKQFYPTSAPIYIRQAHGEEKTYKKRSQGERGLSLSLPSACWGALLFASLDRHALTPREWIFLLFSK